MIEFYNLMPAVANNRIKKNELTISLCPFRYIKGASLLVMMENSKSEQGKKAFLLDKFDMVSFPIVNALSIPSFSCVHAGFGEGNKIGWRLYGHQRDFCAGCSRSVYPVDE